MPETKDDLLKKLIDQFEHFEVTSIEARLLSERDQDYDDHFQWTAEEKETLDNRGQAPIVINHVKNKVNLLTGLQKSARTKPKAMPRTPDHTRSADAVTEGIRFVTDNNDFETISSEVFRDQCVPGYGGAIVEFEERGGEKWVKINQIPWDRYYFDPHSRKKDFSDKNYDGIALWMDKHLDADGAEP